MHNVYPALGFRPDLENNQIYFSFFGKIFKNLQKWASHLMETQLIRKPEMTDLVGVMRVSIYLSIFVNF